MPRCSTFSSDVLRYSQLDDRHDSFENVTTSMASVKMNVRISIRIHFRMTAKLSGNTLVGC